MKEVGGHRVLRLYAAKSRLGKIRQNQDRLPPTCRMRRQQKGAVLPPEEPTGMEPLDWSGLG